MSRRSPASRLGELLPGVLDQLGFREALAGSAAVAAWDRVVGEKLARYLRATALTDGVLQVEAESAMWMQEIGYHKTRILRRLAEECGDGSVQDLKVVLRRAP